MPQYDFSTLSPHDFELLSRDLLQKDLGVRLEAFKSGRDKGIDVRYSKPEDNSSVIVQCKHYWNSGIAKLTRILKKDEIPKVILLNPKRYILTTSLRLSPGDKDALLSLLSPYCQSTSDIFGCEDLNNLLGIYPEIERQHYKLWLPSTNLLERLLHNGVFSQSAIELGDIKRHLSLFVPTDVVTRGMNMLNETGFCMLTGIPGIGKTTTARILVAHHVEHEWDGIYLSSRTADAFNVFRPSQRQIFFYDDFLGQTSLDEKLHKNEDKDLLQLIQACRKQPQTKRLVLTTREYILEQAKRQHEVLSRANIDLAKCTVELRDYTERIRAEILVNHVYFYGVDPETCAEFVNSGDARKTIKHRNYNPRIVQTMCEMQHTSRLGKDAFGKRFLKLLESPAAIWQHAYQHQLTANARQLLLVFAILEDDVTVEALKREFRVYAQHSSIGLLSFEARFTNCLEELEGTFLTIHPSSALTYVTYHNPSVKDFTDQELRRETQFLQCVLEHFTFDETLIHAAKILVDNAPDEISGAVVLDALQRGDCETAFHVSAEEGEVKSVSPLVRFYSLERWLDILEKKQDAEVTKKGVAYAEDFLRNVDVHAYAAAFFTELYEYVQDAAKSAGVVPTLSIRELAERIVDHCSDPEEFVALNRQLDQCTDADDLRERLHERFPNDVQQWLNEKVEEATTSDTINDAITAVTEAIGELGLSEDALELEGARDIAAKMSSHEDAEADMRRDDWRMDRYEEARESRAADDILDSLRE